MCWSCCLSCVSRVPHTRRGESCLVECSCSMVLPGACVSSTTRNTTGDWRACSFLALSDQPRSGDYYQSLTSIQHTNVPLYVVNLGLRAYFYASRRSRTRDTVKLTVCVCVCVCLCVCSSCKLLNGCNVTKTNNFYRVLATFSWILIRGFAN